jgi:hypothetical protein
MIKALENHTKPARYGAVLKEKATGETYTPKALSDFVAQNIVQTLIGFPIGRPLRILDPAMGEGELLISLLKQLLYRCPELEIEVYGFEPNQDALNIAATRVQQSFPNTTTYFKKKDFLEFVIEEFGLIDNELLLILNPPDTYDLIIANPPYVRTQIMGADQAKLLAKQFKLSGRVDLYYAFIIAISQVLKPEGIAGIIVSNRFMTTRSGASIRRSLLERYNLHSVWDLGDTKLFDAAVLPAIIVAEGRKNHQNSLPVFTSIYETDHSAKIEVSTPIQALAHNGVVQVKDGRRFFVQHGNLNTNGSLDGVWSISTKTTNKWLAIVDSHTYKTFGDIGKIRVGVKTCADKVFIRSDWHNLPPVEYPELLRPLTTHHIARRFKALELKSPKYILYPHENVQGCRRAVNLSAYPCSRNYLEKNRSVLESRKYVIEAGREWYEIWVSQDPDAWNQPKLIFRDIANKPTFWLDQSGSIVNGDCYWITCQKPEQLDLLWLAMAIANSSFIEQFYDISFNNKLYAGRRRYITQYVEKFPLPNPEQALSKAIIAKAKEVYECIPSPKSDILQIELENMIWNAFGLVVEEVTG